MSILVDLNGTIAREGNPIQKTVDYLKTVTEDIYIISGSHISKLRQYQSLLDGLGIKYVDIILNPVDQDKDISFKTNMAQTIPNLTMAIDNNKNVLKAYRSIGINAISPLDI